MLKMLRILSPPSTVADAFTGSHKTFSNKLQCVHRSDTGYLAQQHPAAAGKLKPQDTDAFFFFCTDIGGKPCTRELFLMDMVT